MRRESVIVLVVAVVTSYAFGQQSIPQNLLPQPSAQPTASDVLYAGPGVTPPELLTIDVSTSTPQHCKKYDGTANLSLVVDANGQPRSIGFLGPTGKGLDKIALQIATADRFKPGTHSGIPAAIAISMEIGMQTCAYEVKGDDGKKVYRLELRSQPTQRLAVLSGPPPSMAQTPGLYRVGGGISPPIQLNSVEAEFTEKARREKISGICLISLIVDARGMPQNPRVVKSLEPGLDLKALEAAKKYRFVPAKQKDGTPVPVMITVEIGFRFY